jgi:hypothetical protein
MKINLRIGPIAITDIHTWREDLWNRGWTVGRFGTARGIRWWKLLLLAKDRIILVRHD